MGVQTQIDDGMSLAKGHFGDLNGDLTGRDIFPVKRRETYLITLFRQKLRSLLTENRGNKGIPFSTVYSPVRKQWKGLWWGYP